MSIQAFIFDFDGLLLDTEVPIYEAWSECYKDYGQVLSLETYVGCVGSDFNGFDPKTHLESLIQETIEWEPLDVARAARAREIISKKAPMPGVLDLLKAAEEAGVPCAVASSSPRDWVEPWLESLEIHPYFQLTRCLDDVARPKPSPELFLTAAEGLGFDPINTLVFEDSLNGLLAAQAAGCHCLAVPNPVTAALDFSGAVRRIDSLAEITFDEILNLAG